MQDCFFVRIDKRNVRVNLVDILYIQAMKNHVNIVTKKRTFMILLSMRQLEEFLPVSQFVRLHRSYIVALDAITAFSIDMVYLEQLAIPIGDVYRGAVEKKVTVLYSDVRPRHANPSGSTAYYSFSSQEN